MAALLKKRALAEYSQVILEEAKPLKRLRLVQPPTEPEVTLGLQNLSSQDALHVLLRFEAGLPVCSASLGGVIPELLEHYRREKEPVVRAAVTTILARLAKIPGISAENLANELIQLLDSEESHKSKSELLSALCVICTAAASQRDIHRQVVDIANKYLTDSSHLIRSSCLDIIGHLESCDAIVKESDQSKPAIQKQVENFMEDQDPRVRSSAINAMLQLHERGVLLGRGVYTGACASLSDDYEGVRLAAVQLLWVLCHRFPDSMVAVPDSDEEIRLVDDGFVKICNMMNDVSVKVRTKAAGLLGSLHLVSARFLEQTLDKKLMSNMRRKRTAAERARDNYQSGVWSTGQRWADDAPKEELDPNAINLMNIGACGAFIHGLEDEFAEVRNRALDSMCELASQSESFAILSQDSIADMFNDEIESVRLNAINSLKKLSHHLELREDQLEIMLGVLQDASYVSRESLRDMLCEMRLATKECLNACVVALLDNLRRYPQDRLSIWKCMQHLGRNSPNLALPMLPDFLCIHPYFDTPEPEMDDPAYISILMLVFNAAAGSRTALPMFQEHTWRHYTYLRDSLPHLIPHLQHTDSKVVSEVGTEKTAVNGTDTAGFLSQAVARLGDIASLDTQTTRQVLETTIRDLERVTELDETTSASAECVCVFLQSQLLVTQLMCQHTHLVSGSVTEGQLSVMVGRVLGLTDRLQTLYRGLGSAQLALVRQTELKALTFRLASTLATARELATQMKARDAYTDYLDKLNTYLSASGGSVDGCTAYLVSELAGLRSQQLSAVQAVLQAAIRLVRPSVMRLSTKVRKAGAVIHEPAKVSDIPIKFTAGLTAAVTFVADIENVDNIDSLRIQVKYPDTTTELILPPPTDIRKQDSLTHRLTTTVVLSHGQWSESCDVELSLAVLSSAIQMKFRSLAPTADAHADRVVQLCDPVKVLISPKSHKR